MKNLILLFCSIPAFAQYAAIPSTSYAALDAILNGKLAFTTGTVAAAGACTQGKDIYADTTAKRWYLCITTGTGADKWTEILTTGDGTAAGEYLMSELTANGTNYRSWLVPDALTATLRLRFPNALPNAGDVMTFGAPSSDISDITFVAPVTANSTHTFTNKTIDAEGTGILISIPFKFYIPAAGANQTAAGPSLDVPTANGPVANYYGTAPQAFGGLDFADGANALTATTHIALPSDWTGAIDLQYIWFSGSTSTNSAVWTAATACVADTEDLLAPTFNTAQTVSDANLATASTRNRASITSITTTGCAANEELFLRIGRDPTNGSDTLAATAVLLGLEITIRRAI